MFVTSSFAYATPFYGTFLGGTQMDIPYGIAEDTGGRQYIAGNTQTSDYPLTPAAYDTSYNPNSAGAPNFGFNVNWLGDPGISGAFFPGDPLFFQVLAQTNHLLVLVISETVGANAGAFSAVNAAGSQPSA